VTTSINLKHLKLKSEVDRQKTYETWCVPSWMQINWQPLDSPILSKGQPEKSPQEPTRSRDLCGSHFELRPNSVPERSKYN